MTTIMGACVLTAGVLCAVESNSLSRADRWTFGEGVATVWKVEGTKLPHKDFIEQGGRRVGQKVWYSLDAAGVLKLERDVVWPSLRIFPNDTHGSLIRHFATEAEPHITVDARPAGPFRISEVRLDGTLTFVGQAGPLAITRVTFPAFEKYAAVDRWTLKNTGEKAVVVGVAPLALAFEKTGPYGTNVLSVSTDAPVSTSLAAGNVLSFSVLFSARLADAPPEALDGASEEKQRRAFIARLNETLCLETPDLLLNRAFAFAKWRVAEAINDTRGGMMLAPGNLRYYAATWCNDNVEYAGPFFPFLGEAGGNAASLNAYRQYLSFMKSDYQRIPCSIVAEGTDIWGPFDRGDAAMYAYGASRFCLALGDEAVAKELWKGIAWSLEYCKRKQTTDGVIASDTDELEGRLPAGTANLTTASLAYGGLRSAADLGRALGKDTEAAEYGQRAQALEKAIEAHFGATVGGFDTYRYYDGNAVLRSWICMPLSMGLFERKQGTIDALFSPRMWTADGLASQAGDKVFWDRSTLYALRAVFQAGETAKALAFLGQYSRRRLLGEHVPYAVEAYPEGGQGHLASESGLYCRIFTEGMFGILPTGLDRFRCTPRLPDSWPSMALRHIQAFGNDVDIVVTRAGQKLHVQILQQDKILQDKLISPGETIEVVLPKPATALTVAAQPGQQPGDSDFPTRNTDPGAVARHEQKVAAVKSGDYDLVLVGDSITHSLGEMGGELASLRTVWDRHFAPRHALNLGYSGFRTENILWNLLNGELDFKRSPKVFMLLIGTNNTDDQYYKTIHTGEQVFTGTKAIVDLIRQRHPASKILILRTFPAGGRNDHVNAGHQGRIYNRSDKAREYLRRGGEQTAQLADNKHVFWLDVGRVFLRSEGTINADLIPDLIHPNAAGAEAWVQAVEPTLAKLLGDKPIVDTRDSIWLSELKPVVAKGSINLSGKTINIGGMEYASGLGVTQDTELTYALENRYQWFQAWVGLDLHGRAGAVRFQVFTDGQLAYDTGNIHHGAAGLNPHRPIGCRVPLAGVREMKLLVTGDGNTLAAWAGAQLWSVAIPLPDPKRFGDNQGLAKTPPMGWNSWCGFSTGVNEAVVRRNADAMVNSGMKDAGYQYVIIDDWWAMRSRDKDGNLQPDPNKFPQGMKALADYVHYKGLKFGMYTDAKSLTCGRFPGSYGHYEQDAKRFAEWGVDYLKVDWNDDPNPAPAHSLYSEFSKALAVYRPTLYNICEWGKCRPWSWARKSGGHMWRTTFDLIDRWDTDVDSNFGNGIVRIVDQNECLGAFAGPGGWNDLDQLFAGLYGNSWQSGKKAKGDPKGPGCTDTEYRSQMSLWCLLSAPLIAGCDLAEMDQVTRETLTNPEAIALDQDPLGIPAWRAYKFGDMEVWQKPLANGDVGAGLFNRGDKPQTITMRWSCLGIEGQRNVRDLWLRKDLGRFDREYVREVKPHEVLLIRLSK